MEEILSGFLVFSEHGIACRTVEVATLLPLLLGRGQRALLKVVRTSDSTTATTTPHRWHWVQVARLLREGQDPVGMRPELQPQGRREPPFEGRPGRAAEEGAGHLYPRGRGEGVGGEGREEGLHEPVADAVVPRPVRDREERRQRQRGMNGEGRDVAGGDASRPALLRLPLPVLDLLPALCPIFAAPTIGGFASSTSRRTSPSPSGDGRRSQAARPARIQRPAVPRGGHSSAGMPSGRRWGEAGRGRTPRARSSGAATRRPPPPRPADRRAGRDDHPGLRRRIAPPPRPPRDYGRTRAPPGPVRAGPEPPPPTEAPGHPTRVRESRTPPPAKNRSSHTLPVLVDGTRETWTLSRERPSRRRAFAV